MDGRKGTSYFETACDRPWYQDARFNSFWKHYHQVSSWFSHHRRLSDNHVKCYEVWNRHYQQYLHYYWWHYYQYSSSMSSHLPQHGIDSSKKEPSSKQQFKVPGPPLRLQRKQCNVQNRNNHLNKKRSRCRKRTTSRSSHKERKRQNRSRSLSSRRSSSSRRGKKTTKEESDMYCDINIDEDLLKFLAVSAKHRQEREAIKKKEELQENVEDHVDFDSCKGTFAAPKERPGLRRTAEMKMLYGKGAAMIHGMETAMQLTFDRNVDIKQPKPWPNLPIQIKFE